MSRESCALLSFRSFRSCTIKQIAAYMHYLFISLSTMKHTKASKLHPQSSFKDLNFLCRCIALCRSAHFWDMTDNITCREDNMRINKYCWQPFHPSPRLSLLITTPWDKSISIVILLKLIVTKGAVGAKWLRSWTTDLTTGSLTLDCSDKKKRKEKYMLHWIRVSARMP